MTSRSMPSNNFSCIKDYQGELYEYASAAEQYVYADPQSAVIKLRCFAEIFVEFIYKELGLSKRGLKDFFDRIDSDEFSYAVERCVVDKLHLIRLTGNRAAHAGKVCEDDALGLLKEAYFLGAWIYCSYHGGNVAELPEYADPVVPDEDRKEEESRDHLRELEQVKKELEDLQRRHSEAQKQIESYNVEVDREKLEATRRIGLEVATNFDFEQEATRNKIRIEDVYAEYDLTPSQSELVERLDEFLSGATESVFILRGYAGTGKTFITKGLTEYFRAVGRNYILAAPTGKASKVIAQKTLSPAYTIHKTIYSFKDIAEYREDDLDGSETFKYYAQLAVNEHSVDTVYIIDEASMISDIYNEAEFFRFGSGHLLQDFLKFVNLDHNDHSKKVILIGDNAQLPPVGMNFSPALDPKYLKEEYRIVTTGYELTEVVRQKSDSGVMKNSITLRDSIDQSIFNDLIFDTTPSDVEEIQPSDLMNEYLNSCDGKINAESIVIAHANSDVSAYNRSIREHFFPGNNEIAAGDKVMAVANSNVYGFFISNGDFGLVRRVTGETEERVINLRRKSNDTGEVEQIQVPLKFRLVEIGFKDLDGSPHWFEARIIENLLYSDEPNLSSDENKALYLDFCMRYPKLKRKSLEFKETLQVDPYFHALRLKFGYAITCHKAQGSEWNNVFVKCKTTQNPRTSEYFRWLYTAITRTSTNLYLLNAPKFRPWTGLKPTSGGEILVPGVSPELSDGQSLKENREETSQAKGGDSSVGEVDTPDFGIPEAARSLRSLLSKVRSSISESDIEILDIIHNQYQEAYIFGRGAQSARVNVGYNGKGVVKSVQASQVSDLGCEVEELLVSIKGTSIHANSSEQVKDKLFEKEFLNEFHAKVMSLAEKKDIEIQNVNEQQWSLRYTFVRGSDQAVFDVFYNGKSQFSKFAPVINACSPGTLTNEVKELLTVDLNS